MVLKKSWFFIIIYAIIFITSMHLYNGILNTLVMFIILISIVLMIIVSAIAIILSFIDIAEKINKRKPKVFSSACFIFSICLNIFAIVWLVILLRQLFRYYL